MSTNTHSGHFHYAAGLDIGNGYVKGVIGNAANINGPGSDVVDMPSAATTLTHPNQLPELDSLAGAVTSSHGSTTSPAAHDDPASLDWFSNVDVSLNSPLVSDTFRRLVGQRALAAGGALSEFELVGHKSKAEQQLSKVLVLSIVAAKAVRDYVAATGSVPGGAGPDDRVSALRVQVTAALALPIGEYMRHKTSYEAGFTGTGPKATTHTVTVNNFETPVTVQIVFDDVKVIAEGASAMFAVMSHGEPLMETMLADVRSRGNVLAGITAADVLSARNVIGVDVGEGTVNFPVFTGGRFNTEASATLAKGYGTVLEDALEEMDTSGEQHSFTGRKQLAEFLQAGPSKMRPGFYHKVAGYVARQAGFFVDAVAAEFAKVLSDVGAITEVAYVYGGGSGSLREDTAAGAGLYSALEAKATEMGTEDSFPVLYLDSQYSRDLNREGLALAAGNRAAALRAAATATSATKAETDVK